MSQYFLMHKDEVCGSLAIDENTGMLKGYKDHHTGHSPFLGKCIGTLTSKIKTLCMYW